MDCSIQGSSAFHYLQKFAQIHVHWFGSTIYPSHSIPLLFCLQSCLFQMRWLLTSGGQSMRATAPVFPMIILGWFPLELTGLISLLPKRLSRVFSSTTVQKPEFSAFFLVELTSNHDYWKNYSFDDTDLCRKVMTLLFNTLSRFVTAFLPNCKCLLISWLQSLSTVLGCFRPNN